MNKLSRSPVTELTAHTTNLQGIFFDGKTSRQHQATLWIGAGHVLLTILTKEHKQQKQWELEDITIEPPLNRTRRVLKFPDNTRFETIEHQTISKLEQRLGRNRMLTGVNWLESSWKIALTSVIFIALFSWGFTVYGIPALALQAAKVTPKDALSRLDKQTIQLLDKDFLGPSKTSQAKQKELQTAFRKVAAWAGDDYNYQLLIRDGKLLGANAFALPNGTIVMTDQLIKLSQHNKELIGVLAHEVGHVQHRHSLQNIYQSIGIGALIGLLTGDIVSGSSVAIAAPTALIKNGYSRQAERQSDEVGGQYLMESFKTTKPLRNILARLEKEQHSGDEDDMTSSPNNWEMLSTHPGTQNRIQHLREIERNWR